MVCVEVGEGGGEDGVCGGEDGVCGGEGGYVMRLEVRVEMEVSEGGGEVFVVCVGYVCEVCV